MLVRVTVTLVIVPDNPETVTADGYGVAGPEAGMAMRLVFDTELVSGKARLLETYPAKKSSAIRAARKSDLLANTDLVWRRGTTTSSFTNGINILV